MNSLIIVENVTDSVTDSVTDRKKQILKLIKVNKYISTRDMAEQLNISRRTILRDIDDMKNNNLIRRVGTEKGGYWEIDRG